MRGSCLLTLLFAVGCGGGSGDDDDGTVNPPESGVNLPDGATVDVVEGSVQIDVDGRTVLATAPGVGPLARQFARGFMGTTGIWNFSRDNVTELPMDDPPTVAADGDSAVVTFGGSGLAGTLTLRAMRAGATHARIEVTGDVYDSLAIPFVCDAESSFYGFGEQYNATDQKGAAFELFLSEQGIGRTAMNPQTRPILGDEHTTYFPMTYFLDARGFGTLFLSPLRALVDLCSTNPDVAWIEVESGDPLEFVVLHGPTPLDVVRQVGDELGRPTPPPDWAYDLWIGSQGGRDAVLAEADALEAANIPVGALWVQDWTGQRPNLGGGFGVEYRWTEDPDFYPDLAGMIADLRTRGMRFLSYANPFIDPDLDHFDEMESGGMLIQSPEGGTYLHFAPNGQSSHPDFTNAATRPFVQGLMRRMVEQLGMDGWMADFGEWIPLDSVLSDGSDPFLYHSRFPIEWHRTWREVMDEVRPDGDYAVFARSGATGVHAFSQIYWIGDQEATWEPEDGLPTVVPAMLNLGLAGIPFVTHDIAGFSGGPSTKELWQRWTELGAFTPIMRTHEGNLKEDNWSWEKDQETTDHFRRFTLVHQALKSEFMQLATEAEQTSAPILRHLMLQFPEDPGSRGISDQFLIGDQLLVAPVVTEGATSKEVYLPPGTWFHVWTGDQYEGGQRHTVDAPIGSPPVFAFGEDRTDLRAIQ